MNLKEAMDWALANTPRNPDGSLDQGAVVAAAESKLNPEESYRDRAVRAELNRRKRSGQTPPEGTVCLPGMEAFAYEPARLIADDDKNVIELRKAPPTFTDAEARREMRKAKQALQRAGDKQELSSRYAQWAMKQFQRRRPATEVTYDAWVRESGAWSSDTTPASAGDSEDDE